MHQLKERVLDNIQLKNLPHDVQAEILSIDDDRSKEILFKKTAIDNFLLNIDALLVKGGYLKAFALLYVALRENVIPGHENQCNAYYKLVASLHMLGRKSDAARIFYRCFNYIMRPSFNKNLFPPEVDDAYFNALSFKDAHLANILRPCSLFGPSSDFSKAERRIEAILETAFTQYPYPLPHAQGPTKQSQYPTGPIESPDVDFAALNPRVFLAFPRYHFGTGANQEINLTNDLVDTAKNSGVFAGYYPTDLIHLDYDWLPPQQINGLKYNRSPELLDSEVRKMEAEIQDSQPNIFLFYVICPPTENTIQPSHVKYLCDKYNMKSVAFMSDDFITFPNNAFDPWAPHVDRLATCSATYSRAHNSEYFNKAFCALHPFDEQSYFDVDEARNKPYDFVFCGIAKRFRTIFLHAIRKTDINFKLLDQNGSLAWNGRLSYENYIQILLSGKTTLNTGYRDANINILTGRSFEAILAKCLLLEQEGTPLFEYFIPYIHYIPVSNIHQVIHYIKFFAKHEHWRQRITQGALDWFMRHYSSACFWNHLVYHTLVRPDDVPSMRRRSDLFNVLDTVI